MAVRRRVHCPVCGNPSTRVHSHYHRSPQDLPWSSYPIQLSISARRFFCDNKPCSHRIFTEPFPGTLSRYARRTERLQQAFLKLSHTGSAEATVRLSKLLGFAVSGDTLIRNQRKECIPIPQAKIIGVDEFAIRRRVTYGALVVDFKRHHSVAVLEGPEMETLSQWL